MKTDRIILIFLLLCAGALRFTALDSVPPQLNVDEALHAYEAYSVLHTGKDQWGNWIPVTFRAFNDYRRPATIYTAIPFVAIFNLTVFAIRSMAAFWGWWAVLFAYRLARDMFGQRIALFTLLLMTFSPWHIAFSRLGVEASGPLLTSIIAGTDFTWRWVRTQKTVWLTAACFAFALSIYAYTVAQAFTPLFIFTLMFIFRDTCWRRKTSIVITAFGFIILLLPLMVTLLQNPLSWNRFDRLAVLKPPFNESIPILLAQWIGYFSPGYLFIKGDANPIHHPPGSGQLLWIEMILIPLAIFRILEDHLNFRRDVARKYRQVKKATRIVILWVILGALPAAMTKQDMGSANAMRSLINLPGWCILSAIGLDTVWVFFSHKTKRVFLIRAITILIILMNAGITLEYYFWDYAREYARAFEYGLEPVMHYVLEHEQKYNKIILTDWISQPHIFALFYSRYPPDKFQENHAVYGVKLSEKLKAWGEKYETGDADELYSAYDHGLFVVRPHMLEGISPSVQIYHPDGSLAFKIIVK